MTYRFALALKGAAGGAFFHFFRHSSPIPTSGTLNNCRDGRDVSLFLTALFLAALFRAALLRGLALQVEQALLELVKFLLGLLWADGRPARRRPLAHPLPVTGSGRR